MFCFFLFCFVFLGGGGYEEYLDIFFGGGHQETGLFFCYH